MRRTSVRVASIAATVALIGAGALVASAPANAAGPIIVVPPFTAASNPAWEVPAGVHSITYRVVGGPGGNGAGVHGGLGGDPIQIQGTLAVEPGWDLLIYAGQAGGDATGTQRNAGGLPGLGGDGWVDGGAGGQSGNVGRPGAGGGGSSAIIIDDGSPSAAVVAGGAGGGGGRGLDDIIPPLIDACVGGAGGDSGDVGTGGVGQALVCGTSNFGAVGLVYDLTGGTAPSVANPNFGQGYYSSGGGGGGGGGAGGAGNFANQDNAIGSGSSGGGGGAGGASLIPSGATSSILADATSGVVEISYQVEFITVTEAVVSPKPAAPGQNVTITATVENVEGNDDPTGTVDFSIPGCNAVALDTGTAGDSESTAECTFVAGDPSTVVYGVWYTPGLLAPFAPSNTEAEVVIAKVLPATGPGLNPLLIAGGSTLLLLLGGALILLRRRTV